MANWRKPIMNDISEPNFINYTYWLFANFMIFIPWVTSGKSLICRAITHGSLTKKVRKSAEKFSMALYFNLRPIADSMMNYQSTSMKLLNKLCAIKSMVNFNLCWFVFKKHKQVTAWKSFSKIVSPLSSTYFLIFSIYSSSSYYSSSVIN